MIIAKSDKQVNINVNINFLNEFNNFCYEDA